MKILFPLLDIIAIRSFYHRIRITVKSDLKSASPLLPGAKQKGIGSLNSADYIGTRVIALTAPDFPG